jgi:hypothetical protein
MKIDIFVVFIILDNINHEKSTSIFQINEAIFIGDKVNKNTKKRFDKKKHTFLLG